MTIALIDQYPLLRMGLNHFLGSRFRELSVQEYESINSFYKSGPEPELVVLGINGLGSERNFETVTVLKQRFPSSAILVYDDKVDTLNALRYLKAGATGYLSKSDNLTRLEEAVREVLKGKRYIVRDVFEAILEEQIVAGSQREMRAFPLTPAEHEVAGYLIKGMKTKFIAEILDKRVSTISTFKNRIFRKLNVGNVIELKEKMGAPGDRAYAS